MQYTPDTEGCPTARTAADIVTNGCEDTAGEAAESPICILGRIGLVVLLASALALAAVATCLPPAPFLIAAAGFFLAFLVVAVLWALLCDPKPCHWFLLVTGEAMFAAGLMLANVIGCCPTLGYIGGLLVVAGVLMMIAWAATCDFDACVVFQELAFVTVGVLAQISIALVTFCGVPSFAERPIPASVMLALNLAGVGFIALGIACLAANGLTSRLNSQDRHRVNPIGGRPTFPDAR